MFDYRNNLKKILSQTASDDKSLANGLAAIKVILGMADDGVKVDQADQSAEVSLDAGQLNQLLLSVALLLTSPDSPQARKSGLTALHKLMFAVSGQSTLRQSMTKLEHALRKSEVTQEAIDQQVFKQAVQPPERPKRDYRKGKRYTVIRLLAGCDLVNDGNRRVYTLTEAQIHDLNLKSGDIVEALPAPNPNYEAEILRIVGHRQLASMAVDQISTFKYAVVQGQSGHLAISRNIKGQKLRIRGKVVLLPVDASKSPEGSPQLSDGSIVDLAWYDGDVRIKKNPVAAIQIRWVYPVDQAKPAGQTRKKKPRKAAMEEDLPHLALDLHYQRVGIAVGDNQNEAVLEGIVNRYNGIPIPIDAFQGKKKLMEKQIKDLDIVILVTAFAAHDSTWNIREFASKYHVKFAVSSSKGYQSFERALYRAANELPAYEGNQTINYRTSY